jgi:hypothetical protein
MHLRKAIQDNIDKHGHHVMGVGAGPSSPSFAYTIGLTAKYGTELIVFALPMNMACGFLNQIAELGAIQLEEPYTDIANFPLHVRKCTPAASKYGVQAEAFYGRPVQFCQVILCDRAGKLPWEAGFDHAHMGPMQPLLYVSH